jgi:hypothetical protein
MARAPGTIPSHVNPPKAPSDNLLMGAPEPPKLAAAPAPAPAAAPTRVANAAPAAENDGWFSSLARKVGIGGGAADATASTPPAKPKVIEAKQTAPRPDASPPKAAAPKPDAKHAAATRPPLKPSVDTSAPAGKDNQVLRLRADRVDELVRQPLRGGEVRRATRRSQTPEQQELSCAAKAASAIGDGEFRVTARHTGCRPSRTDERPEPVTLLNDASSLSRCTSQRSKLLSVSPGASLGMARWYQSASPLRYDFFRVNTQLM